MSTALVVEDCLTDRQTLVLYLKKLGFNVLTAESGAEARAKLQDSKPDIILLDIVLPDRSGFELCREFKSDPEMNKIPIIFCSSKGTELDKFWGLRQGASAYLVKPLVPEELIDIIEQLTKSKNEQKEIDDV